MKAKKKERARELHEYIHSSGSGSRDRPSNKESTKESSLNKEVGAEYSFAIGKKREGAMVEREGGG
jgi:hypothetical protein